MCIQLGKVEQGYGYNLVWPHSKPEFTEYFIAIGKILAKENAEFTIDYYRISHVMIYILFIYLYYKIQVKLNSTSYLTDFKTYTQL